MSAYSLVVKDYNELQHYILVSELLLYFKCSLKRGSAFVDHSSPKVMKVHQEYYKVLLSRFATAGELPTLPDLYASYKDLFVTDIFHETQEFRT